MEGDKPHCPVDHAVDNMYRLVAVVSHYGGTALSGHYVSDVYSVEKELWLHYDDSSVSCAEDDASKDIHRRNGYISFIHQGLLNQVVSAGAARSAPCPHALPTNQRLTPKAAHKWCAAACLSLCKRYLAH